MTARPRRVIRIRPIPAPTVEPPTYPAEPPTLAPVEAPPEVGTGPPLLAGELLRPAAAAAAALVFGLSSGSGWVAVVALALAAGPLAGVVGGLGVAAAVARWGTSDLGVMADDQAVLGIAIGTGDLGATVSSALAALALLLLARVAPGRWPLAVPVALGLGATVLAAGPAVDRAGDLVVRIVASVVGVVLAVAVARFVADRPELDRPLRAGAVLAGVLALLSAVPS